MSVEAYDRARCKALLHENVVRHEGNLRLTGHLPEIYETQSDHHDSNGNCSSDTTDLAGTACSSLWRYRRRHRLRCIYVWHVHHILADGSS